MADVQTEKLIYIVEVQDNGSAAFDKISKGMKALESDAQKAFSSIGKAGITLASDLLGSVVKTFTKMGETVKEAVVDSIKAYADFEEQMLGARRTMDLTDESVRELIKHTQQLALNFEEGGLKAGTTTATLAEIEGIAGQMGITFEDGAERFDSFVTTVAKASGGFEISAQETASALGIISTIFDLPIEKANELGGAFVVIGQATVATVPELLNFTQRVGAAGTAMGLTANEAIAMGGMFREAGVPMEIAGTAVINIFNKMKSELDKFSETLAAGGLSKEMLETAIRSKDAAGALELVIGALSKIAATDPIAASEAMKDLGLTGRNATLVLESLMAQFPKFAEYVKMIEDPMGNIKALNDAYEASLKGLNKQWDATKNILTIIAQIIGEKLSMALANVLEKYINPFLLKFSEWIQNSPVAQAILTELGRTIEIIGTAIGNMLTQFMAWLQSLDTLAGQTGVHEWFATFHSWIEKLINEGFSKVKESAEAFWNFISTTNWGQVWRDIVDVLKIIRDTLKGLGSDVNDLMYLFQNWNDVMDELWNMIAENPVARVFGEIIQTLSDLQNKFMSVFKDIGNVVENLSKSLGSGLVDALKGVFDGIKNIGVEAVYQSVFPDMVDWAGKTADAVGSISSQTTALVSSLSVVGQATSGVAAAWDSVTSAQQRAIDNMTNNPQYQAMMENARRDYYRMTGQIYPNAPIPAGAADIQPGASISGGIGGAVPSGASPGWFGSGAGNGGGGSMWAQPQHQVVTPSAAAAVILTINAGANLLDEYTLSNFALQIEQYINETRGRTVRRIG